MVDTVVTKFDRLPITQGFLLEFVLDPGKEVTLQVMQNPYDLRPGEYCNTYAVRFNCVRDVRSSLQLVPEQAQLISHKAKPTSTRQRKKYAKKSRMYASPTWWFRCTFDQGELEVEAESFTSAVIARAEIRRADDGPPKVGRK